jgi:hypothetical protein
MVWSSIRRVQHSRIKDELELECFLAGHRQTIDSKKEKPNVARAALASPHYMASNFGRYGVTFLEKEFIRSVTFCLIK